MKVYIAAICAWLVICIGTLMFFEAASRNDEDDEYYRNK